MNSNIIEIKKEYTITLVNVITPLIYEGLKSLYDDAVEIGKGKDILLVYQSLLRRVPKWSTDLINRETQRIREQSRCCDWFDNLVRAVIKSNMIILSNTTVEIHNTIRRFYDELSIEDFIHKCYIQCSREMFNNPYLMYHNLIPVEIKKNQRECCNLIKESIKEAIRKILPMKHILSLYLDNDYSIQIGGETEINSPINDKNNEMKNLNKIINKDIGNMSITNESDIMQKIQALANITDSQKKNDKLDKILQIEKKIDKIDLQDGGKKDTEKSSSVNLQNLKIDILGTLDNCSDSIESIIGSHNILHSIHTDNKILDQNDIKQSINNSMNTPNNNLINTMGGDTGQTINNKLDYIVEDKPDHIICDNQSKNMLYACNTGHKEVNQSKQNLDVIIKSNHSIDNSLIGNGHSDNMFNINNSVYMMNKESEHILDFNNSEYMMNEKSEHMMNEKSEHMMNEDSEHMNGSGKSEHMNGSGESEHINYAGGSQHTINNDSEHLSSQNIKIIEQETSDSFDNTHINDNDDDFDGVYSNATAKKNYEIDAHFFSKYSK